MLENIEILWSACIFFVQFCPYHRRRFEVVSNQISLLLVHSVRYWNPPNTAAY